MSTVIIVCHMCWWGKSIWKFVIVGITLDVCVK